MLRAINRINFQTANKVLFATPVRVHGSEAAGAFKAGQKPPKVADSIVYVTFMDRSGHRLRVPGRVGSTVLDVAKEHHIDIFGGCDGALACTSCHVLVNNESLAQYPEPSLEEKGMLQEAIGLSKNSRLACQIVLTKSVPETFIALTLNAPAEIP